MAATRAKENIRIYTDNMNSTEIDFAIKQEKTTTLNHEVEM